MKATLLTMLVCFSLPVLAIASTDKDRPTASQVLDRVAKMYERECGNPSRCSLTIDARGSCPFEVGVSSPVPVHEGNKPNKEGNYVFWLCLDKQGTVQHRLNGTARNWPRA